MSARTARSFVLVAFGDKAHQLLTLGIAKALAARGHRAVVLGPAEWRAIVDATGATFRLFERFPEIDLGCLMRPALARKLAAPLPNWLPSSAVPFVRARQRELEFRRQLLLGSARMAEALGDVLSQEQPDVLVADCFSFGARYAAEATQTKFVTTGADPTFALNPRGTLALPPAPWMRWIPPTLWRWAVDAALPVQRIRRALGLPPQHRTAEFYSMMVSETLHISSSLPEMMRERPPAGHRFVGPLRFDGSAESPPPLGRSVPADAILVTGTTTGHPRAVATFVKVAKAVAALGQPTIIVATGLPDFPRDLGPRVVVFDGFVSHDQLLPFARVWLTHGGWGAVGWGLRAGVPMMVIPGFGPQYMVGERLAELGLGHYVHPEEVTPERMGRAIAELLGDQALRDQLRAVRDRLATMDSELLAAEALEQVAAA
jgi:UDP:flavonoid glycosyltransferase YjiC (YdhE family)